MTIERQEESEKKDRGFGKVAGIFIRRLLDKFVGRKRHQRRAFIRISHKKNRVHRKISRR